MLIKNLKGCGIRWTALMECSKFEQGFRAMNDTITVSLMWDVSTQLFCLPMAMMCHTEDWITHSFLDRQINR